MKKVIVFNGQFAPKLGGQFELEWGGQFAPKLVVNLHWKVVVNLTGFSSWYKQQRGTSITSQRGTTKHLQLR